VAAIMVREPATSGPRTSADGDDRAITSRVTPTSRPERASVPIDEIGETPEERALVEESRAEHTRTGKTLSQEDVEALIAKRKCGDLKQ
jgi:hypothetical protein